MRTLICGSLAYDTIMVFEGRFKDQILPDQVHILNVAFLVPASCAANSAAPPATSLTTSGCSADRTHHHGDGGRRRRAPYLDRLAKLGFDQGPRQDGG